MIGVIICLCALIFVLVVVIVNMANLLGEKEEENMRLREANQKLKEIVIKETQNDKRD